jgi:hypothetical protein
LGKKSREERILTKTSKEKVNGNETKKESKNYNRKELKSVIGGTFWWFQKIRKFKFMV